MVRSVEVIGAASLLSMVGWGWVVDWGRLVGWGGLVLGVLSNTLIPDVSDVARVTVSNVVGHNLGATVGEGNAVLSSSGVSIPLLILAKVGSRVRVSDSVLVSVDGWGISVSWGGSVVGWGTISWGGRGSGSCGGNQARSDKGLKDEVQKS